jgi:hypothetical protein
MQVKDAFVRSARTAGVVFVTTLTIVSPAADLAGVKTAAIAQATSFAGAALYAVVCGFVNFVVCLTEDNTAVSLPK